MKARKSIYISVWSMVIAKPVTRRVHRQTALGSLTAWLLLADARSRDATAGRVSSAKRIWRARRV